ncbi:hypothetical protein C8Q77DRAFT_662451 [Trametes polyzona]|nr:hypothetical protein C8Q77DRAFT_662451 [Trametes polyzona]
MSLRCTSGDKKTPTRSSGDGARGKPARHTCSAKRTVFRSVRVDVREVFVRIDSRGQDGQEEDGRVAGSTRLRFSDEAPRPVRASWKWRENLRIPTQVRVARLRMACAPFFPSIIISPTCYPAHAAWSSSSTFAGQGPSVLCASRGTTRSWPVYNHPRLLHVCSKLSGSGYCVLYSVYASGQGRPLIPHNRYVLTAAWIRHPVSDERLGWSRARC